MTGQDASSPSSVFARPVPERRFPQRLTLRLDDGYETYAYVHRPVQDRGRLPVLYVHGIQSHPGWFVGSALALADAGHTVFQVARRGSGENRRARGDAASAGLLLRDLGAACRFIRQDTGADRLHLLGVSWGGKLVCALAAETNRIAWWDAGPGEPSRAKWGSWPTAPEAPHRPIGVASVTLVSPGIVPKMDVSPLMKLAIAACLILCRRRTFAIPLSDVELFTDNEPMREYLRGDPYRLQRATARFLYASRRLDRSLRRAPAGALKAPTTLILAARDRIIDNSGTREVIGRLSADRAVVEELEGSHTLEFQPDPRPFYAALVSAVSRGEAGEPVGRGQYPVPK